MRSLLIPWRPLPELETLRAELDHIFDGDGEPSAWRMAIDVTEEKDKLVVRGDLPGFKPEEIKVELADHTLTISAEHEEKSEEETKRFTRRERRYGAFRRVLALPEQVEADDISAVCKDGVLEVTIALREHKPATPIEITPAAG